MSELRRAALPFKRILKWVLIAVSVPIALVLVAIGAIVYFFLTPAPAGTFVDRAEFKLPDSGFSLAVERRTIGSVFAEYDRVLIIKDRLGKISTHSLFVDTGGASDMSVFKRGDQRITLADRLTIHEVDLAKSVVTERPTSDKAESPDGVLIGWLKDDKNKGYRFVPK